MSNGPACPVEACWTAQVTASTQAPIGASYVEHESYQRGWVLHAQNIYGSMCDKGNSQAAITSGTSNHQPVRCHRHNITTSGKCGMLADESVHQAAGHHCQGHNLCASETKSQITFTDELGLTPSSRA